MLELNTAWTSSGSTAALTPVHVQFGAIESVLYVQNSTIATTNSFQFQTAQDSTGPWFVEASTACGGDANLAGQAALRLTGPYRWMRPQLKTASTGTYTLRLIVNG